MSYQPEFRPGGFQTLPPVIKNLLIINILLFAATWVLSNRLDIDLVSFLGLHYYSAPDFRPHQFVTYLFMHGSFAHLFFNMFAVWMFGSVLENVWGSKKFLVYYLITGFGAALIQYLVFYFDINPIMASIGFAETNLSIENFENLVNSDDFQSRLNYESGFLFENFAREYNALLHESPEQALSLASQFLASFKAHYLNSHIVIGASGSLFGLLLAFGMMFPNTYLYIYFLVPIKAKWFVILYGALELFSGLRNNPLDNVAHFAHLGGMLFGFLVILYWKRKQNRSF